MLNRFFTSGKIAVAAVLASIVIISDFSNLFAQEFRFLSSPALIRFDLHPLGINHEIDDIASELGNLRSTANIAFIIYRVQVQNIGSQLTPLYAQALLRDRSGRIIRYSGFTQAPFESIGPSQIVSLEFGVIHGDFRNHNQLGYEPPSGSLSDILGGAIILLLKSEPHGSVLNDLSVTIPDITNLELEPALIRVALLRNAVIRPFINFSNNERYQIGGDRLNWSFSNPNLIYFPGFGESVNDPFFPFNFEPIAYRSNINFVDYERINILDFSVNANLRGIYTFMTAFIRSNQPVSPANVVGEIVSLEIGIN